jgi:hypothetical protein
MAPVGQEIFKLGEEKSSKPFYKKWASYLSIKSLVSKHSTSPWPSLRTQIMGTGEKV